MIEEEPPTHAASYVACLADLDIKTVDEESKGSSARAFRL